MNNNKRTAVQGLASILQNANFKGFFTGKIYSGQMKHVCVPGLNCYSCPGAVGSCPVGSLQSFLSSYSFKLPYYVMGLLLFFGALLGRAICGFLCPFGLLQDLIHKIPFPKKIKKFKGDKLLRKLKYAVLIICVIVLPVFFKLIPVFCKYICPSGTVSGLLLALSDTRIASLFGGQFMWKVCILGIIVLLSILIYRPFCKYVCPLGAIYAPLNKVSVLQMKADETKCTHCSACYKACEMCVNPSVEPNSTECIRCGKCIEVCPVKALSYTSVFSLKQAKNTGKTDLQTDSEQQDKTLS